MNKYKKLLSDTLSITVGNFASKIIVFLMMPFYTMALNTSEYGITDLIYTTTNLLYPIFTLLMSEAVLRFALDKCCDKKHVFSTALKCHGVGFLLLILLSPLLRFLPQIYELRGVFLLYYFFIVLQIIVSQFAKSLSTKHYAISGFLNTLVVVILNILFLKVFNLGVMGYLFAYIIGAAISTIYLALFLKLHRYISFRAPVEKGLFKQMTRYSVPMIPNSMCWWLNNSLDRYVLLAFYNVSIVGIYSAANKIPSLMTVFSSIFINAWQLSAIDDFGSEESKNFFGEIYRKYSSLIILLSSVIIFATKIISSILLNKRYWAAADFAQILVFAFIFQAMSAFLGTVFTSSKKTNTLFVSTLSGGLINLLLNIILIPYFSYYGAAIATAISYIIVWIIRYVKSMKIIKFKTNLKRDLLSYLLIMVEIIFIVTKIPYFTIASLAIIMIIFIINLTEIKNFFQLKRLKKQDKGCE